MALGTIFVITPTIGFTWPALAPLITVAAAAIGFQELTAERNTRARAKVLGGVKAKTRTVTLSLDEVLLAPVADEVKRERQLLYERDGATLIFRRDVRGKFQVLVEGHEDHTIAQLRSWGEEFAKMIVQQFAHNRVVQELERRGMLIVEERTEDSGDIVIRGRRWS
jgi:hypothetical protein